MATNLPDPLATASGPIAAYMSGHESANLAYVKHFGKKTNAVSATFKSLNSKGFLVAYKTEDGTEDEVFIDYTKPVTKREDVRVVLEDMAKEGEAALGMPSSLNGPPPFKSLMKAAAVEDAQNAEIQKLQEDREAEASASIAANHAGKLYGGTTDDDNVALDVFYPAERFWQTSIAVGMGATALLGYASDEFLKRAFPSFVLSFRNYLTSGLIQNIFKYAVLIHLFEGTVALFICLKRNWYSPLNVLKWTVSTTLYGFASMKQLVAHGKRVEKAAKKNN